MVVTAFSRSKFDGRALEAASELSRNGLRLVGVEDASNLAFSSITKKNEKCLYIRIEA